MQILNGIYCDELKLDSYEVDPFYHAHTAYYFRIMQEAAGAHAYYRGVSIPHLQKEGKTWVVTRTKMNISQYASWPNTLQVKTWPQEPWKLYYPRVCRLYDNQDQLLFQSLTHWVVMDQEKQRPIKPSAISDRFGTIEAPAIIDPDLGRRFFFDSSTYAELLTYEPRILYGDCDFNRHVNNVTYLEWILESLPFSFRDSHLATDIDIAYLAQTYREDTILVITGLTQEKLLEDDNVQLFHEVVRISFEGERQQVCTAATTWKNRADFSS